MSFFIELFCVVTLQYQILVRIAIAYFIIEKKKAAPQPWQAIAQRFCSPGSYRFVPSSLKLFFNDFSVGKIEPIKNTSCITMIIMLNIPIVSSLAP